MVVLTLIATLLASPCCDDAQHTQQATPPADLSSDYGAIRMNEEPLQVWLDFSYGSVEDRYDEDGDTDPLEVLTFYGPNHQIDSTLNRNAKTAALTLQLGGKYDLFQLNERSSVQLGAQLSLARHKATDDSVLLPQLKGNVLPKRDVSSGFTPQNLALSVALDDPSYTLRAAYLFDLGPQAEHIDVDADEYWNSDQRDALRLDVSGRHTSAVGYRFFGGASYIATTTHEADEASRPDVLQLHGGLGFRSSDNFEVGLTLLFRDELPSLLHDPGVSTVFSDGLTGFFGPHDRGRLLSVEPYATYQASDAPFQIRLKAGLQGEYFDYGYSFWGKNEIAPGLGVTAGITYGLF